MSGAITTKDDAATLSGDALALRVDQAAHDSRGAYSDNTLATYGAGVRKFVAWCDETGQSYSIPVQPRQLAAFVDHISLTLRPASVSNYVSAITAMHRDLDFPTPADTSVVRNALKRMKRTAATSGKGAQKQAAPLQRKQIDAALSRMSGDVVSLRDAALICLAYDTMCRSSELVALNVSDIKNHNGRCSAFVSCSKTDQDGRGVYRYVSPDTYARVMAWAGAWELSGDEPLFPPVSPAARVDRIAPRDVSRIYKRRIGVTFTAHSTRVGSAVDQLAAGASTAKIMQAGGWKSPAMVARYTEQMALEQGAAADLARSQGRAGPKAV